MTRLLACGVVLLSTLGTALGAEDEVPAPFARFEPMVGAWKGTARPAANKVRGWAESHAWAWKFAKGVPVGMTLNVDGGKVFARGQLGYDEATKAYTLDATDPAGKPIQYTGVAAPEGKPFVLDRVGETAEGKERITIRPNGIRYTMRIDRQAPGAPQFKNAIEVGLTKAGEAFASGGDEARLPKCILTGGSAALTVSFNGKSYPVCCTGCRDEFNDNPEKYVARAEARAKADGDTPATAETKPAPSTSRGDGEFDGLVDAPKPKAKVKAVPKRAKP